MTTNEAIQRATSIEQARATNVERAKTTNLLWPDKVVVRVWNKAHKVAAQAPVARPNPAVTPLPTLNVSWTVTSEVTPLALLGTMAATKRLYKNPGKGNVGKLTVDITLLDPAGVVKANGTMSVERYTLLGAGVRAAVVATKQLGFVRIVRTS